MSTASSGLSITTIDLTPWRGARNIGNIRFAHRSKTLVTVFRVLNFARLLGLCWALHHTGTSRPCFLEISQPIFLATFVTKSSREHECWVEKICMEAGLKQKNCCQWVSFQVHQNSKMKELFLTTSEIGILLYLICVARPVSIWHMTDMYMC